VRGTGWESYPLSLRIVNWIKWTLTGHLLTEEGLHSLAIQARYLSQRLEIHLLGNHLFANAKALVFAGLFFQGTEAETWLHQGLSLLRREVPEQILADGGHFERSPMYHSIILEDLLDLINLTQVYTETSANRELFSARQTWQEVIPRMLKWLTTLCHPDGQIALFNDAAFDIAPSPAALQDYAQRLGLGSLDADNNVIKYLRQSGYLRLHQGEAVALLDVGEIGPDYLPGHAHADTLSFELSLFGQRVLVNSGTSCYGQSLERLRQRSTLAHNTVVVNGRNSSEVWAGFRVARRARPFGLAVQEIGNALRVTCAHDGYSYLPGQPIHWREWCLEEHQLTVQDRIEGDFKEAVAQFHFHPALVIKEPGVGQTGLVQLLSGAKMTWEVEGGSGYLDSSTYHPQFGVSIPNLCLTVKFNQAVVKVIFRW
jgi:uncharacterized heparinase superfamily protein